MTSTHLQWHLLTYNDIYTLTTTTKHLQWPLHTYNNIIQWGVNDFIVIRKTVELVCIKVEEDMVSFQHTVSERMRLLASALEVLTTYQARIAVYMRQRYGAQLLEVKIKNRPEL